jgi:hypothetical protein
MPTPERLKPNPWRDVRWTAADKPVLILDGAVHRIREITNAVSGEAAYAVGVDQKTLAHLCQHLDVRCVSFYEMRAADLSPLTRLTRLRELAIRWNTKVTDIAPLQQLTELEALVLEHVPRVGDLALVRALRRLRMLEFSGGIWSKNRVSTLAPLADLPLLAELTLTNLAVGTDGLRPLAGCHELRSLTLSNQFPTEDYAFLSVKLPNAHCQMFAPFVKLSRPIGSNDVMIVGKGKPLLCSAQDQERLARYVSEFKALQKKHG